MSGDVRFGRDEIDSVPKLPWRRETRSWIVVLRRQTGRSFLFHVGVLDCLRVYP